ncbi:MAG TPA: glycosyltransferase family 4 protein [Vicinamibacteria bacterium]|nr:glycosyltransferase family 4 protein [Vicinamibacteria bacterium]
MRIAFVSPLPPAATGIADYAAEVLGLLAPRHALEAFHEQPEVDLDRLPPACRVFAASELPGRHAAQPYDAVVYQMGNGPAHAFLYPLLRRVPGLLVLHDLVLHHSRARMFLDAPEVRAYAADPSSAALRSDALRPLSEYTAELRHCYPGVAERLAEAQLATVGPLLPYAYPLFRLPVEVSRATAVHNAFMAAAIRDEVPDAHVFRIPMPVERQPVSPVAVTALRRRYGLAPDAFVVASLGLLTPEKRIATVAHAVGRVAGALPHVRLLLVGPVPDRAALDDALSRAGIVDRTVVTGRVPFTELAAHLDLADVAVHLRYPTARETSAALLHLLAQGRATVMSDLEHLAEVPDGAVVRVDPVDEEGDVVRALLRLAERPEARRRIGERAQDFVQREHAPAQALEAYEAALVATAARPAPQRRSLPAHWTA